MIEIVQTIVCKKENFMKKLIALLVVAAMIFSLSFTLVSCGGGGDNGDGTGENDGGNTGGENDGGNTEGGENDGTGTGDPEVPVSYTATEKYFPASVSTAIYDSFAARAAGFVQFSTATAPFTYADVYTISNARVLEITIPVMATKTQNENGNFIFTLYKVRNSSSGVCASKLATYAIEISAAEHGLSDNASDVYKTVTVDLSDYDIALSATETLSFGASTDTLVPAVLTHGKLSEAPLSTINNDFPQALGVFNSGGKESATLSVKEYTLCFDLVLERTFETAAERDTYVGADSEYDRIVAALKQLYAGKKISVIGDSISTFDGFTSNPSYNLTLSVNSQKTPYYPTYDKTTSSYTKTYWGRLLTELDMQLCVANAISGGFVSNSSSDAGDPFQDRAGQLHRDNGTKDNRADDTNPDVIVMYQGINDLDNGRSTGNLITELKRNNGKSDMQKVAEWFSDVLANYRGDGSWVNFDAAYALAIYNMIESYGSDVEIYCVTLVRNYSEKCNMVSINNYNRVIMAIAEYFGATVVDQNGALSENTSDTFYTKTCYDGGKFIHVNSAGHLALEHLIVKTMAEKNGLI